MIFGILLGFILTVLAVGLYLNLTGQCISIEPDTGDDWDALDYDDEEDDDDR